MALCHKQYQCERCHCLCEGVLLNQHKVSALRQPWGQDVMFLRMETVKFNWHVQLASDLHLFYSETIKLQNTQKNSSLNTTVWIIHTDDSSILSITMALSPANALCKSTGTFAHKALLDKTFLILTLLLTHKASGAIPAQITQQNANAKYETGISIAFWSPWFKIICILPGLTKSPFKLFMEASQPFLTGRNTVIKTEEHHCGVGNMWNMWISEFCGMKRSRKKLNNVIRKQIFREYVNITT